MNDLLRRYGGGLTALFGGLTGFWILALVVLPYLLLLVVSFRPYLPVDQLGGPNDHYTLSNYATFFHSPIHMKVFGLTVLFSSIVTFVAFGLAYPLAYYLAKIANVKSVPTLFLLLLIPLWVSEILRTFAWFIILSFQGPLNAVLGMIGIGAVRWLTGFNGVIIGLVYTYVLFMLFPIYNSISTLDTNQIEAAQDLGAKPWRIHWRVIMPHAKPGIASGCVMVFMLSAGSIIVPSLLQSTSSRWFTEVIWQYMFESQDWNTGSAYAFLLLLLCTIFVSVMMRVFKVRLTEIAR